MVLRQHTPSKLERILLQNQSILVPTKLKVRVGETGHCIAWSTTRQPSSKSINRNISSHLFADGSAAAHAVETRAYSLAKQEHRDAAQGQSTFRQDRPLRCLAEASTSASMNQPQHLVAPMSGWFSGSTRRRNSSVFSCKTRAS
jgi:hypothetical protein